MVGGWGWVPAYVDFDISPGDYRNPLKFKVRTTFKSRR